MMNGAHLHLLLTHIPVLGIVFGLLLLAFALLRTNRSLINMSLGFFVLAAVFAGAVYLSGEQAEAVVEGGPGISAALIEAHEQVALYALVSALMLGAVALFGLLRFFQKPMPTWFVGATLVLAVVTSGVMAWTAHLGGQINHPEIRATPAAAGSSGLREDANPVPEGHREEDEDDH